MKMYLGMVPLKKNSQGQQTAKNLAVTLEMLNAINPKPKYEKEQREKAFMESQQKSNPQCCATPLCRRKDVCVK